MKLINLLACVIMKCDVLCYDTCIKMADHGQQYNNVRALVMFFLAYNVGIDW